MKFNRDWWWVIYRRRDGVVLSACHVDYTEKSELRKLTPAYKGFPCKLVRGPIVIGRALTAEQLRWSFRTASEALSSLHDEVLRREG